MLATGLSALYSSLPRKIEVRGDDWHALRREDWIGVSSLVLFMNSLEFCNAVVQVAHPLVRSQLLDYLHNGFLVPVMGPALHKVGKELQGVPACWQLPIYLLENNHQDFVLQFKHKLYEETPLSACGIFFKLWVNWPFKQNRTRLMTSCLSDEYWYLSNII